MSIIPLSDTEFEPRSICANVLNDKMKFIFPVCKLEQNSAWIFVDLWTEAEFSSWCDIFELHQSWMRRFLCFCENCWSPSAAEV